MRQRRGNTVQQTGNNAATKRVGEATTGQKYGTIG
jgi:hypothetical protein